MQAENDLTEWEKNKEIRHYLPVSVDAMNSAPLTGMEAGNGMLGGDGIGILARGTNGMIGHDAMVGAEASIPRSAAMQC